MISLNQSETIPTGTVILNSQVTNLSNVEYSLLMKTLNFKLILQLGKLPWLKILIMKLLHLMYFLSKHVR